MTKAIERWPGIRRACMLITVDNGGLNRYRPENTVLAEMESFLFHCPYEEYLDAIDDWLDGLDEDALDTVCCGERSEIQAMLSGAPPFTNQLLDDYFEEVC